MAITRVGITGSMAAYGTFQAKSTTITVEGGTDAWSGMSAIDYQRMAPWLFGLLGMYVSIS